MTFVYDHIEYGFKIAGMIFSYIAFADDLPLITYKALEMNILSERLRTQSKNFGLNINISKTKVMFIGNHAKETACNINGVVFGKLDSFQYLERVITNNNNDTKAVEKLISKGWNAYNKVKAVLKDQKTPMSMKKKTFEIYILPCLMYDAETITWRKNLLRKMDVFQNNILRICTNKRKIDRILINTLLMMTRLTPVSALVKHKKLTWFSHLKRGNLPVRAVYEGMVSGKRSRGRPIQRWRNNIYKWIGRTTAESNHMVKNQNEWHSFVDSIF